MMRVAPLFFFASLLVTACTLKTKSACPENPSPDDPSCEPVDCEDNPTDVRCTASTRDGGTEPPKPRACVQSTECKDRTASRCDQGTCGKCRVAADCERFTDTPVCSPDGVCVPCTDGQIAGCTAQNKVCKTDTMQCVECNTIDDCKNSKLPVCDGNVCRGCKADADCAINGELCREETGECVKCVPNAEGPEFEGCANGKACDPATFTCVGHAARSMDVCGRTANASMSCVSDNECFVGQRCIQTSFRGGVAGAYCLQQDNGQGCPRQTALAKMATSSLGVAGSFCFPDDLRTTCAAIASFRNACVADDDCGAAGVADGRCEAGQCTYECESEVDCSRTCGRTNENRDRGRYCSTR